jgi:hypothetical protein
VAFYRSYVAPLAIGDTRVNQFLPWLMELRNLQPNIQELLMSSSDRGRGDVPGARHEPDMGQPTTGRPTMGQPNTGRPVPTGATPVPADPADPYANWLDRMQRARARHAAITRNLYTWSNYKNWADKMRDNWEEDEAAAKAAAAPGVKPVAPRK